MPIDWLHVSTFNMVSDGKYVNLGEDQKSTKLYSIYVSRRLRLLTQLRFFWLEWRVYIACAAVVAGLLAALVHALPDEQRAVVLGFFGPCVRLYYLCSFASKNLQHSWAGQQNGARRPAGV
jgi:hypothetical protein